MNIKQIEIFNAIMIAGSVSAAARLLHLSVPAVSQALMHTESRLGFSLFTRAKGRLYPTQEAKVLVQMISPICRQVQDVADACKDLKLKREGFVSIVSSPGIGRLLIPKAISRFYETHNLIKVRFETRRYEPIKENILTHKADFGITTLPIDHPNIETKALATGKMLAICPFSHPLANQHSITLKELAKYDLIAYPAVTPFGMKLGRIFSEKNLTPNIKIEVGASKTACAMVAEGLGVAVVDEFSLLAWRDKDFAVVQITDAEPFTAHLVRLHSEPLTNTAEIFIGIVRQLVEQYQLNPIN